MEHFRDLLFQRMKHETKTLHVFIFLFHVHMVFYFLYIEYIENPYKYDQHGVSLGFVNDHIIRARTNSAY